MSLSKKEVRVKLQEAVGKPVKFHYPRGKVKEGHLKERVIVWSGWSEKEGKKVSYWDVVDLIDFRHKKFRHKKFPHKRRPRFWIRIGYYRVVRGKLRWAGQTTITEPFAQ